MSAGLHNRRNRSRIFSIILLLAAMMMPGCGKSPEVLLLGKPGVDVSGPAGIPDGQPDVVIQVTLPQRTLREVSAWEIETSDHHGHWTSAKNPNGWWLIKAVPDTEQKLEANSSRIKLYFAGTGDFDNASAFILRALDNEGDSVFEQTVQK